MPVKLYGIPNCGTVKKSRIWLKPNVIKRPVLEHQGKALATGFSPDDYEQLKL